MAAIATDYNGRLPSVDHPVRAMSPPLAAPSLLEMTGKADFTAEEWELLREGPPTAGIVTLMA